MFQRTVLVFDEFVYGTTTVNSPVVLSPLLGRYDLISLRAVVTQIDAPGTFNARLLHSADGLNWLSKNPVREIHASIATGTINVLAGADGSGNPSLALVRVDMTILGGATQGHVKMYATLRDKSKRASGKRSRWKQSGADMPRHATMPPWPVFEGSGQTGQSAPNGIDGFAEILSEGWSRPLSDSSTRALMSFDRDPKARNFQAEELAGVLALAATTRAGCTTCKKDSAILPQEEPVPQNASSFTRAGTETTGTETVDAIRYAPREIEFATSGTDSEVEPLGVDRLSLDRIGVTITSKGSGHGSATLPGGSTPTLPSRTNVLQHLAAGIEAMNPKPVGVAYTVWQIPPPPVSRDDVYNPLAGVGPNIPPEPRTPIYVGGSENDPNAGLASAYLVKSNDVPGFPWKLQSNPMTVDTPIDIKSLSKTLTAVGLMAAIASMPDVKWLAPPPGGPSGHSVSDILNQDIGSYLFAPMKQPDTGYSVHSTEPAPIRLYQLLHYTSGLDNPVGNSSSTCKYDPSNLVPALFGRSDPTMYFYDDSNYDLVRQILVYVYLLTQDSLGDPEDLFQYNSAATQPRYYSGSWPYTVGYYYQSFMKSAVFDKCGAVSHPPRLEVSSSNLVRAYPPKDPTTSLADMPYFAFTPVTTTGVDGDNGGNPWWYYGGSSGWKCSVRAYGQILASIIAGAVLPPGWWNWMTQQVDSTTPGLKDPEDGAAFWFPAYGCYTPQPKTRHNTLTIPISWKDGNQRGDAQDCQPVQNKSGNLNYDQSVEWSTVWVLSEDVLVVLMINSNTSHQKGTGEADPQKLVQAALKKAGIGL